MTVTILDGLVLARSAFEHSVSYESAILLGTFEPIIDPDDKLAALETFMESVLPGQTVERARPVSQASTWGPTRCSRRRVQRAATSALGCCRACRCTALRRSTRPGSPSRRWRHHHFDPLCRLIPAAAASPKELKATTVLAMQIAEASVKTRSGPPDDDQSPDAALDIWAGVIPIRTRYGAPEPSPGLRPGIPLGLSI